MWLYSDAMSEFPSQMLGFFNRERQRESSGWPNSAPAKRRDKALTPEQGGD